MKTIDEEGSIFSKSLSALSNQEMLKSSLKSNDHTLSDHDSVNNLEETKNNDIFEINSKFYEKGNDNKLIKTKEECDNNLNIPFNETEVIESGQGFKKKTILKKTILKPNVVFEKELTKLDSMSLLNENNEKKHYNSNEEPLNPINIQQIDNEMKIQETPKKVRFNSNEMNSKIEDGSLLKDIKPISKLKIKVSSDIMNRINDKTENRNSHNDYINDISNLRQNIIIDKLEQPRISNKLPNTSIIINERQNYISNNPIERDKKISLKDLPDNKILKSFRLNNDIYSKKKEIIIDENENKQIDTKFDGKFKDVDSDEFKNKLQPLKRLSGLISPSLLLRFDNQSRKEGELNKNFNDLILDNNSKLDENVSISPISEFNYGENKPNDKIKIDEEQIKKKIHAKRPSAIIPMITLNRSILEKIDENTLNSLNIKPNTSSRSNEKITFSPIEEFKIKYYKTNDNIDNTKTDKILNLDNFEEFEDSSSNGSENYNDDYDEIFNENCNINELKSIYKQTDKEFLEKCADSIENIRKQSGCLIVY